MEGFNDCYAREVARANGLKMYYDHKGVSRLVENNKKATYHFNVNNGHWIVRNPCTGQVYEDLTQNSINEQRAKHKKIAEEKGYVAYLAETESARHLSRDPRIDSINGVIVLGKRYIDRKTGRILVKRRFNWYDVYVDAITFKVIYITDESYERDRKNGKIYERYSLNDDIIKFNNCSYEDRKWAMADSMSRMCY
jgi:hypothetical protein